MKKRILSAFKLPETPNDYIRLWYWTGAFLVFLILIIGGITRLTQSGLSIVEWSPIMGTIPPLSETDWEIAFDKYKQYPEYQQLNKGMNMSEFKYIFFWEYLHRLIARITGLIFIIPLLYFLYKKYFDKKQSQRAFLLLVLGLSQGFMGWFMVQSGLIDTPMVSPFRLASHLLLAFTIFGCCVWFALDLRPRYRYIITGTVDFKKWTWAFISILSVQLFWGALVAGHKAGYLYNTFPKMEGSWIPETAWILEPIFNNLVQNPATVQWVHRVLGTVLLVMVLFIFIWARYQKSGRTLGNWTGILAFMIILQYLIGVYTLLWGVPVSLGVIHQAMAMILFGVTLGFLHFIQNQYKLRKRSGKKSKASRR